MVALGMFSYAYFPQSPPLTSQEIEEGCYALEGAKKMPSENVRVCEALLSKQDTGQEMFAVNFMQARTSTDNLYPEGFTPAEGCDQSVEWAQSCYAARILPLLFKRFSFPFFAATPLKVPFLESKSLDIGFEGVFDEIAIVRYRSRRDFLDMMQEFREKNLMPYKEASVGKTMVYIADADQVPLIVVVLFVFWSAVVTVIYSVLFRIFWFIFTC